VSAPDPGRDLPPEHEESATAAHGSAAAVDVAVDPRARTSLAVFLAGPVIGVVHFLVVYLVAEAGCTGDGPGLDAFDPPVPAVVTGVATVVAALACCGTALWAYRRARPPRDAASPGLLVDRRPLAFMGLLLSLLALVTVLLVGSSALVLGSC
jgi:heme/copper-type cytochrome/quinol oxidase subunit 3